MKAKYYIERLYKDRWNYNVFCIIPTIDIGFIKYYGIYIELRFLLWTAGIIIKDGK